MSVPVAIRIEWRVGIDMEHRRQAAVIGLVHVPVDGERALLEAPEFPHRTSSWTLPVEVLDRDPLRQIEHVPEMRETQGPAPTMT